MPICKAVRTFKKGSAEDVTDVYLLDEIFKRTMKCHCERVYCSRFMRSVVDITAVSVNIEVTTETGYEVVETISYKLAESGYPDSSGQDIYEICPDLSRWNDGVRLNGQALKSKLEPARVQ